VRLLHGSAMPKERCTACAAGIWRPVRRPGPPARHLGDLVLCARHIFARTQGLIYQPSPRKHGAPPPRPHHVPQAARRMCVSNDAMHSVDITNLLAASATRARVSARALARSRRRPTSRRPPRPRAAIGRLCEKCDGKCVICDSYVRPTTPVRVCDECNFGSYCGRCVICGAPGSADAFYCKECTQQEKDVRGARARGGYCYYYYYYYL
jgi:hypothetical protein